MEYMAYFNMRNVIERVRSATKLTNKMCVSFTLTSDLLDLELDTLAFTVRMFHEMYSNHIASWQNITFRSTSLCIYKKLRLNISICTTPEPLLAWATWRTTCRHVIISSIVHQPYVFRVQGFLSFVHKKQRLLTIIFFFWRIGVDIFFYDVNNSDTLNVKLYIPPNNDTGTNTYKLDFKPSNVVRKKKWHAAENEIFGKFRYRNTCV